MRIIETKLGIYGKEYEDKLQHRLTEVSRHLTLAKQGLKAANKVGNLAVANKLTAAIADLEQDLADLTAELERNSIELDLDDEVSETENGSNTTEDDTKEADSGEQAEHGESNEQRGQEDADEHEESDSVDSVDDSEESGERAESGGQGDLEDSSESGESGNSNKQVEPGKPSEELDADTDAASTSKDKSNSVKDPFHSVPGSDNGATDNQADVTVDGIIKILKRLKSKSKLAVIKALQELRDQKAGVNEACAVHNTSQLSLVESVVDLSDAAFSAKLDNIVDLVNQVARIDFSDDLTSRAEKIKKDLADQDIRQALINAEQDVIKQERRAAKAQSAKTGNIKLKSMSDFKLDLYRTIKRQITQIESEDDSYSALSRRDYGKGALRPGKTIDSKFSPDLPILNVYIDQSGSFDDNDIQAANRLLAVLQQMEQQKKIKLVKYYFANHVYKTPEEARAEGGTSAWPLILQSIKDTAAGNVAIFSDSDLEWDASSNKDTVIVEGGVWLLWRNSNRAPTVSKRLIGKATNGSIEYTFTTAN